MDRLGELTAFVRLVELGSQSAAAQVLGVTPAMVGRHLRALEERLGVRLLQRTTRRQSLTEAGTAFYEKSVAVLEMLDEAERAATEGQADPRGVLRFTGPVDFGARHLGAAIATYCERYPDVRVEMVLNDRVVDLIEEGFDLAVRMGRLPDSSHVARRLTTCPSAVCASPDYLRRHGEPRMPAELVGHNCLLYAYVSPRDLWLFRDAAGRTEEVRVSGNLVANNGTALMVAAVEGQGIVTLPLFILADALRRGRLVRLLPGYVSKEYEIHAVYPGGRNLSPKLRHFIDVLAERFRDTQPWADMLG